MNELDDLLRDEGKEIQIFTAIEITDDPNYNDKTATNLNPHPIKALVFDISYEQAQWKMPGLVANLIKKIIVKKRYKKLLEKSRKIVIDGDDFYGYKPANGTRMQIKTQGDYLIVMVHNKEIE